jgi:LmbE family N-acetylglucosaminyl deacetylase
MQQLTVVSPHLDDAAVSVGALIRSLSSSGVAVTVLTVLAGDPLSRAAAGRWDTAAGFGTAGEAAQRRREEDRRACRLLGAVPVWLPFCDDQYKRGADDGTIAAQLARATANADVVLVPGFPLLNPDHAWVTTLVSEHLRPGAAQLGFYVEQPYAAQLWEAPRLPAQAPPDTAWSVESMTLRDVWRKNRAVACYRSQRQPMGPHWYRKTTAYERSRGGETVAWPRRER